VNLQGFRLSAAFNDPYVVHTSEISPAATLLVSVMETLKE